MTFPTDEFQNAEFLLLRQVAANRLQGGGYQVAEIGEPIWSAKFQTVPMYDEDVASWRAWSMVAGNGLNAFPAYDPSRIYPIAYGKSCLSMARSSGGVFDGTASLIAWTATTLTLSGLPSGYQARPGDMLSFSWGGSQALHMVVSAATGTGVGTLTVSVQPHVRLTPAPQAAATVKLVKPTCMMVLVPDTFSAPLSADPSAVSFQAIQVVV